MQDVKEELALVCRALWDPPADVALPCAASQIRSYGWQNLFVMMHMHIMPEDAILNGSNIARQYHRLTQCQRKFATAGLAHHVFSG
jgi:hypothetical protein